MPVKNSQFGARWRPFLVVEGGEVVRGNVTRVGVHGDQVDPPGAAPEYAVGLPELLSDDRAIRSADGVEERECDRLAAQAGERHRVTVLVHQADSRLGEVERLRRAVDRLGQEGVRMGVRGRHRHRCRAYQRDGERSDGGGGPERVGGVGGQPFPPWQPDEAQSRSNQSQRRRRRPRRGCGGGWRPGQGEVPGPDERAP